MSSASALFYGRRSRLSRTFLDLTSSDPSPDPITRHHHHHRHHHRHISNHDYHHRLHRRSQPDHAPPSPLLPERESQSLQRGCVGESSSQFINSSETASDLTRRYCGNNRLPGSVLLAKERLLQRLRGASVFGDRETSPHFHCHDILIDADRETSSSQNPSIPDPIYIEAPSELHHQSTPEELKKKPLGLTKETLSQLYHEVFNQTEGTRLKSKASNDCSICLENFVEGNELVRIPCGHRFHTSCLYPWLQTCGDCPYCRYCILIAS